MSYYTKYTKYKNKYLALKYQIDNNTLVQSGGNISCSVWYTDSPNFTYPELTNAQFSSKKDIGIALPGGGLRACVYSLGVLRGLQHLDILKDIKYITSDSGSSWLTSIFCYRDKISNKKFLGDYIAPEDLTKEKLSTKPPSSDLTFTSVLHDTLATIKLFEKLATYASSILFRTKRNMTDPWSQTIGDLFYTKYKLNDFTSVPCICTPKNDYTVKLRSDVPFLIIRGYIKIGTTNTFIEFTPLYYGIPIKNDTIKGSGVYIEPVGMLSITQGVLTAKNPTFNITPANITNNVISIMKSAGISSNVIPAGIIAAGITLNRIPNIGWNVIPFVGQELRMIDEYVSNENNGITSLIKRRVKNIIFVCPIDSSDDTSLTKEDMIRTNSALSTYFNQTSINRIFDNAQYEPLIKEMLALCASNKPIVVKVMQMKIVTNARYGIVEDPNYSPTITFIHPSKNEWLDKIHESSKKYINSREQNNYIISLTSLTNLTNANFRHYPYTNVLHENYSIELVNAMSQNAAYDVISSVKKSDFGIP